ncbi:MAG: SDR family oxidoreductase [Deltaproteobacteria bacterium]|nr:SDR family oxidoreductase [Deltaproteobacteria bacterium]
MRDRVTLVIGAGSGIGRACARLLAERGDRLVLAGRQEAPLRALAAELGSEVEVATADVSLNDGATTLVSAALRRFGRLDAAINTFGMVPRYGNPLDRLRVEDLRGVLAANLRGVFLAVQAEAQVMSSGGAIVVLGSVLGEVGWAKQGPFSAAKHGIRGLCLTWAKELEAQGVRLNVVEPGLVQAPTVERLVGKSLDAEGLDLSGAPDALAVARTVVWLSSDDSRAIQGQAIGVGGHVRRV